MSDRRDRDHVATGAVASGDRLDLLLSSIREAEVRLAQDQAWVNKPKPVIETNRFAAQHQAGEPCFIFLVPDLFAGQVTFS